MSASIVEPKIQTARSRNSAAGRAVTPSRSDGLVEKSFAIWYVRHIVLASLTKRLRAHHALLYLGQGGVHDQQLVLKIDVVNINALRLEVVRDLVVAMAVVARRLDHATYDHLVEEIQNGGATLLVLQQGDQGLP